MKALGYARVSTEEQAREGISVDAQRAAVRAYCDLKGIELRDVVVDLGVSASKPLHRRPGGMAVLTRAVEGEVGAVVATRLDRLFRDAADCLSVTQRWDKRGVALHLIDLGGQAVDTSSAMGRFFLTIMAAVAEMERGLISERIRDVLAYKRGQGERYGEIPYGYRLGDDGVALELDDREQKAISYIVRKRKAGFSIRWIASSLNLYHATACRGERWHKTTVARILRGQT